MSIPSKPFPTYKWRWLSVLPIEGLLKAPVFLGVLRALQRHESKAYRSIELYEDLRRVQEDTGTDVTLAKPPKRNLFRQSGQYWRGTGLVAPVSGIIQLTHLGHSVASGRITNDEFAALMVRNTVLPNPLTYPEEEMQNWRDKNLRIKPLELILAVMNELGQNFNLENASISPNELIKVIIPLSGEKTEVEDIASAVYEFRQKNLDISDWPDCAPDANDKRFAREFLLFLGNFGICQSHDTHQSYEQRFYLDQLLSSEISPDEDRTFFEDANILDEEVSLSSSSEIPIIIERGRVATSVIQRPNQARFRRDVLDAASRICILTQETTPDVLEAAHIIPVRHGGTDSVGNGFCMRVDIHRLFDGGKIRIGSNGTVTLSEHVEAAVSYADLPRSINFPPAVDPVNVEWRSRYL
ncbi:MAG: HNH endonuclease [Phormidesmis sp. CAN_BIN44]|nr:HNH endonuclease [Phormidesmis sp. CAN_BIN44]